MAIKTVSETVVKLVLGGADNVRVMAAYVTQAELEESLEYAITRKESSKTLLKALEIEIRKKKRVADKGATIVCKDELEKLASNY
jgi:hypothetical protein